MTKHIGKSWTIISMIVLLQASFTTIIVPASEANKQKAVAQRQIKRLQKGITAQRSKIQDNSQKELSLYNELKKVDSLLDEKQRLNITSQKKLLKQESFLQEKELELNFCQTDKQQAEKHIKNRLRAFYKTGDIGIINALFSSSTLPDLLNTKAYFRSILESDNLTIKRYRDQLAILNGARGEIINGKEQLLKTIVNIKNQEKELIAVRQERKSLLLKIQTERRLYEQALKEMEESAKGLAQKLTRFKAPPVLHPKNRKRSRSKKGPTSHTTAKRLFTDFKGSLPTPVKNALLLGTYGASKGIFGAPIHSNGIDIQVKENSTVRAIYKGTIVYAGEMEGYGNLVIMSHDEQYFTLLSRLTTLSVTKGMTVVQGSQLGTITPSQSGLLQKGLHLEIRKGSTPEDPLLWLDKSQFTL